MEIILKVFLPVSLAVIMFSLGVTLKLGDFKRVATMPRAFSMGIIAQVLLLPAVAFALLQVFPLDPPLAFGVMILSFAPGGVTSNMLTKMAGGSVALSVSLTAVVSLLCVVSVPLLVALAAGAILGSSAPPINITSIAISMALITAIPVGLGVFLNHVAPRFAYRISGIMSVLATVLFVVIVIGAIAANWSVLSANIAELGPILISLNVIMLALGYGGGRMMKLGHSDSAAIALEVGVQNATLGITVGAMLSVGGDALPTYSLASGIYGITMYLCAIPFVYWLRRKGASSNALSAQEQAS